MSDDIVKWIGAGAFAALSAFVGLLWRTVTGNRDGVRDLEARMKRLEDERVTKTDIADAITKAMDRAEEKAEKRRADARRTYRLETKELVREALREALDESDKHRTKKESA